MAKIRVCFNILCGAKFVVVDPIAPWSAFCPACRASILHLAHAEQLFEKAEDPGVSH